MNTRFSLATAIVLMVTIGSFLLVNTYPKGLITSNYKATPAAIQYVETSEINDVKYAVESHTNFEQIISTVEESEYHIKQFDDKQMVSPNRAQDMRITYAPDRFSINQRNKAENEWDVQMQIAGVFRDNQQVYAVNENAPQITNANHLEYDHGNWVVQYINDRHGMRQNFIVNEKPQGATPLAIKMEVQSSTMQLECSENALKGYINNELQYTYSDLKVWDAEGTILAANMTYEDGLLNIEVADANAQYPIIIDPLSETQIMVLEEEQENAEMGCAIAGNGDINGDGFSDLIVGAHLYDKGNTDEGIVFVYYGSESGLSFIPADTLESNQDLSEFGLSVAIAGDVNNDGYDDVIVGANLFDNGELDEGVAFVYHGTADGLNTTPSVILECNQAAASFGISVSSAGDVNADGYDDVLVGASLYDNGETDEGRVFVYHGSASGINTTPAITIENNQAGCFLGYSVSEAGDVNADGYDDVVIGAPYYDGADVDQGIIYVHHGSASGLNPIANIQLGPGSYDEPLFGYSVSEAGDINNDGYDDILASRPYSDYDATNAGGVHVYYGSSTGIVNIGYDFLHYEELSAYFGISIAAAGDVNNDGYDDIIAGAPKADYGQIDEGRVYVYFGNAAGVENHPNLKFESNEASSKFGTAVCNAGDVNGDGKNELAVGATFLSNRGAVFVYGEQEIDLVIDTIIPSGQISSNLGASVSSAGDINGDGYDDFVAGASQYDNGETDEGAVFIYYGSATGVVDAAPTMLESNQAYALLGWFVSAAGDINADGFDDIVAGAFGYENGETDEGAAFIYYGSATGIIETPGVVLELNQASARFGYSCSTAGDVNADGFDDVIIGAPYYFNGSSNEGGAFVYHGSAAGLITTPATSIEGNASGSFLGCSVSGAGDVNNDGYDDIIVGLYGLNNPTFDEGGANIYHGSASGIIPTLSASFDSNKSEAYLGWSVSGAGDINGDGYDDVVAGAPGLTAGQIYEGRIYICYGSATGIIPSPTSFELNTYHSEFGHSVSNAGDINSDGYDDIIVGAWGYDDEGAAFIFAGSPTGIQTTPFKTIRFHQLDALFGSAVSDGGDINNDGLPDLIIGGQSVSYPILNEGAVFVILGKPTPWYYIDDDGDGYGDIDGDSIQTFNPPFDYVANNLDCNDNVNTINPNAIEICNEIDDDCDGLIDNGVEPDVNITAGGPTTFCSGGNVTLTATHTGTSVQWKKNGVTIAGATSDVYTAYLNGNYTCEVTGDCGITVSTPILVTVNKNPTASITAGGPTSFCAGGSVVLTANAGAGLSYQWFKGGAAITGATSISYTATTAGNYKCQVTKTATGCGKNSNKIGVEIICREGENVESLSSLTLYPNPATTVLYVVAQLENGPIQILNDLGQLIIEITPESETTAINIEDLPKGIYLVRYGSSVGSIVKQ